MKYSASGSLIICMVAFPCFAQSAEDVAIQIRPAVIAAHMRFLADDLLEGRGTGTRGYEIAARYVAAQFEALGLAPAGSGHSYFQQVPLRKVQPLPEKSSVTLIRGGQEEQLVSDRDFVVMAPRARNDTSVRGQLVFAGFGVAAPELGHNDYEGLNVQGKIVVVLKGSPSRFPSAERAHFSDISVRNRSAAAHGAIGVAALWTSEIEKVNPFESTVRILREPRFCWLTPDGVPNDEIPELRGSVVLSQAVSSKLFENSPKTLDQALADARANKSQGFPLTSILSIRSSSRHTAAQSSNVIGVLRGSDPRLRDEYVVYSAHLDHMGIGPAIEGDSIYNGAQDNASGVAALIEVARSFTRLPRPPRRSILFVALTGEESGLLGSDYFVHYPSVPIASMVANVNIDELPMNYESRDIVALGEDHSTLGQFVRQAAQRMNLEISPDPSPEQGYFVRSDQYSFVRQGVPAVFLNEGLKTVDPKLDGRKIHEEWNERVYHTPKDDMNQPLNFGAAARSTRLNFLIGYLAAQAEQRPQWNPGDFFGRIFAGIK